MKIGNTIRFLRTEAGLKQNDFADRIGVSQNYLSLIENGKREPSISFIKKVSETFDIPYEFFLINQMEIKADGFSETENKLIKDIKMAFLELQTLRMKRHEKPPAA